MLRSFLDILFPPLCHLCKVFIPDAGDVHLCAECRKKITPITSPLCDVCGVPFGTEEGIDHRCGRCLHHTPHYTAARAAFVFDGPIQELIHRFKYGHKTHLHRPLAKMTADALSAFSGQASADLVVPVPLHKKRLRWRSYNQAALLASVLAKEWGLELALDALRRTRWTEPQIQLAADRRHENVKGAFAVSSKASIAGRKILLVDDVLTTGSTIEECASTLVKAGAEAVYAVTIARAKMG